MKVFTFWSDSHKELLNDWFLKSIPDDVEVLVKKIPQECPTGAFHEDGWMKAMAYKIQYIIDCCKEEKDIFIHADCDIQFFGSFKDEILKRMKDEDLDILAQNDGWPVPGGRPNQSICCGFMAIRPSKRMADFFQTVYDTMGGYHEDGRIDNDQDVVNRLLIPEAVKDHNGNIKGYENPWKIKWDTLDEKYYSIWRTGNAGDFQDNCPNPWKHLGRRKLPSNHHFDVDHKFYPLPVGMVMHHANYIKGVEPKIVVMTAIKKEVKRLLSASLKKLK